MSVSVFRPEQMQRCRHPIIAQSWAADDDNSIVGQLLQRRINVELCNGHHEFGAALSLRFRCFREGLAKTVRNVDSSEKRQQGR